MGAPSARASELAYHWSKAGHDVSVLTGFPNHPTGVVPEEWKPKLRRLVYHQKIGAVDVFRTWLWPLPNRKAHERMRNYASFCLSAAIRGMALPSFDVAIGSSPQLLVALAAWWIAFSRQVPFVFEVRDLWPESLAAVGVGNEDSVLHRTLGAVAGFLYEHADRIVVVTPAFREYLVGGWNIAPEKIAVVENGVETDLFAPSSEESRNSFRRELAVENRFLVCYIGTMGMAHGLETLLEAASELQKSSPNVLFLLVGEGAEKERIRAIAQSRDLGNVRFLDQQAREKIPALIAASDASVVLLKKTDVFKTVIPTKMLEFMACGCPVILGVDGQARRILDEAGAGIAIKPENADALAGAILDLQRDPSIRRTMGQKGREYIVRNLSRAGTAEKYINTLAAIRKLAS